MQSGQRKTLLWSEFEFLRCQIVTAFPWIDWLQHLTRLTVELKFNVWYCYWCGQTKIGKVVTAGRLTQISNRQNVVHLQIIQFCWVIILRWKSLKRDEMVENRNIWSCLIDSERVWIWSVSVVYTWLQMSSTFFEHSVSCLWTSFMSSIAFSIILWLDSIPTVFWPILTLLALMLSEFDAIFWALVLVLLEPGLVGLFGEMRALLSNSSIRSIKEAIIVDCSESFNLTSMLTALLACSKIQLCT